MARGMEKKKALTPAQQRRQETRRTTGKYDNYKHVPSTLTLGDDGTMEWLTPEPDPAPIPTVEPRKVTYSFREQQARLQEDFEKHFSDVPTRFFTTNFSENYQWKAGNHTYDNTAYRYYDDSAQALLDTMPHLLEKTNDDIREWIQTHGILDNSGERMTVSKLARSVTTKDDETRDIDAILEHTQGATNAGFYENRYGTIKEPKIDVEVPCWRHRPTCNPECKDCTTHTIIVADKNRPTHPIGYYHYRFQPNSSLVSRRELAGLVRLGTMTDNPHILSDYMRLNNKLLPKDEQEQLSEKRKKIASLDGDEYRKALAHYRLEDGLTRSKQTALFHQTVTEKILDKQAEGANFHAQRHYWENMERGTIARSFEEKKNPDKTHAEWAHTSPMTHYFSDLEADNDTDITQVRDFEREVMTVMGKLPKPKDGAAPALRIRKLGKHDGKNYSVTGLYTPTHNTIVVSEKDSGSFIHEYGHYIDHVVADNASLSTSFRSIVADYKRALPPDLDRRDYYTTPTEVYARAFEIWAHEKQGITSSRVLHENQYKEAPEYKPLHDPDLKQRFFTLFDKLVE